MHTPGSMQLLKILLLKCELMHIMVFDEIANVLTSISSSVALAAFLENGRQMSNCKSGLWIRHTVLATS